MSYRANNTLDMHVLPHRDQGHGPRSQRNGGQDASVLIDATLKENFPPISLPKREYMERAKVIWEELGLPKLKPEAPWFGYSLGEWSPEFDAAAEAATRGDYFTTAAALEKRRRKDVRMNTEVRHVKESASPSRNGACDFHHSACATHASPPPRGRRAASSSNAKRTSSLHRILWPGRHAVAKFAASRLEFARSA